MVKIAIYVDTSGSMNERIKGEMDPNYSGVRPSMFRSIMSSIGLKGKVKKSAIYRDERFSDHAPITMDYDWVHAK